MACSSTWSALAGATVRSAVPWITMLGVGRAGSMRAAPRPRGAAGHGGEGGAQVGRGAVGEPGVHGDGGEEVGVGGGQDRRHRAAGGQAGDEDAAAVDGPRRRACR